MGTATREFMRGAGNIGSYATLNDITGCETQAEPIIGFITATQDPLVRGLLFGAAVGTYNRTMTDSTMDTMRSYYENRVQQDMLAERAA